MVGPKFVFSLRSHISSSEDAAAVHGKLVLRHLLFQWTTEPYTLCLYGAHFRQWNNPAFAAGENVIAVFTQVRRTDFVYVPKTSVSLPINVITNQHIGMYETIALG
jgi:hypothetical protein